MLTPPTTAAHRRSAAAVYPSIATVANAAIEGVCDATAAHRRAVRKTFAGARPHRAGRQEKTIGTVATDRDGGRHNLEVGGSNPVPATFSKYRRNKRFCYLPAVGSAA